MRTKEEQIKTIGLLPEVSLRVYKAILDGLYAEPGFSDLEVVDVARETDLGVLTVKGAVGYLVKVGLVETEDADVNFVKYEFLHAPAHDQEWKDEAYAAIEKRMKELKR